MHWQAGKITTLMAVIVGALCACTAPTTIKSTWRDPTFSNKPFDKVAVLALFESRSDSRAFEQSVVDSLKAAGVSAVSGSAFLDSGKIYSHEEMEDELFHVGAEGILIFKLIAVDEKYRYRPPTYYIAPHGFVGLDPYYGYYYPHWYYHDYWYMGMQVTADPGYWQEREYYVIETALYNNKTDRLVWTAKSETLNPDNIDELSKSVINQVEARLLEQNYFVSSNLSNP